MPYNKEYYKQWRQKNREKIRQYARKYHKIYDKEWKQGKLRGKPSKHSNETQEQRNCRLRNYYNRKNREYRLKYRKKTIDFLGAKCYICNNTDYRVLQIDHVNGKGSIERKLRHGTTFFRKILKMKLSEAQKEYQVLCANCHAIKTYHNS